MRHELDIYAIKQRIPEIMGMNLVWKNNAWQGGYYINGERHSYRKDKLKVRVWNSKKGNVLFVHEEGGESMSIQTWLQRYGGAANYREAMEILEANCTPKRELLEYIRPKEGSYVPESIYEEYKSYPLESCNLYNWMCRLFGEAKVREAWERYNVTTNERGQVVFWFRNNEGKLCHDKIVSYLWNGHRDKGFGGSRRFKTSDGFTERCLFGSHLIDSDDEIINIVESEKTAIACYCAFGGLWLATGGKGQLRDTDERTILYPDMDAICEWREKGNVEEWWVNCGVELGEKDDMCDMIEKKIKNGSLKV